MSGVPYKHTLGALLDDMDGERPVYHAALVQGTDEWLAARCGLLTASEMDRIMTPTLKVSANDKSRAHVLEMAAQRITRHVEPRYIGDDMLRGMDDEHEMRRLYSEHYATAATVGFVTRRFDGFTIGYSPDGLVGDDGLIEGKSRRQRFQVQTIASHTMPADYVLQVQTGLLVTGRKWLDFISYSAGLPMVTIRVLPDPEIHAAILDAAASFEQQVATIVDAYNATVGSDARLIPTDRTDSEGMIYG